jgi:hypothetical protein
MRPIGDSLQKAKAALLQACDPNESPLRAWPIICGSNVSSHSQATSYEGGRLTVLVSSHEWKSQLEALEGQYVVRLNAVLPAKINGIAFVTRTESEVAGSEQINKIDSR